MNSKTAIVTGADGFIGSHLVEDLVSKGYKVKAFCMYNSLGNYGWLENLAKNVTEEVEVILGDIRDPLCVKEALKSNDIVFHLAALISIPYSYVAPKSYIETNVLGTLNILQAAKELNISRVIHTSTSETYCTAQFVPINEEHPINAQSPYAASKVGADQLALSYWRSFNTPISIIRPFNTYGPRQSNRAVIPSIISQIHKEKVVKLGSLTPTRDFSFVKDTTNAFIEVSKSNKTIGRAINSASNFEISIGRTAEIIANCMNKELKIELDQKRLRPKNSEVERLYGDNRLLKSLTDWEPSYSGINGFKQGIKETIDWFSKKENLKFYKSGELLL